MSTFKVDQVDFQTEQYVIVQSAAAILCAHTVLLQFQMPLKEDVYIFLIFLSTVILKSIEIKKNQISSRVLQLSANH